MGKDNVLSRKKLNLIVNKLRKKGKKIVFTNGCFDIIHLGHVRYLESAKKKGDILIVGINTDKSVRKLKGKKRPLTPEKERAEIVASLKSVDYVTLFKEDTPCELISILKPDIHVKGADYKNKKIPEQGVVKSYGGKVVLVPLVKGKSSTRIINKIK